MSHVPTLPLHCSYYLFHSSYTTVLIPLDHCYPLLRHDTSTNDPWVPTGISVGKPAGHEYECIRGCFPTGTSRVRVADFAAQILASINIYMFVSIFSSINIMVSLQILSFKLPNHQYPPFYTLYAIGMCKTINVIHNLLSYLPFQATILTLTKPNPSWTQENPNLTYQIW